MNDINTSNNSPANYAGYGTWYFCGDGYINFTSCVNNSNKNSYLTYHDLDKATDAGHLYLSYSNYANNPSCADAVIYVEDNLPVDISSSNFINNVASWVFYCKQGSITVKDSYCPIYSTSGAGITAKNLVANKICSIYNSSRL